MRSCCRCTARSTSTRRSARSRRRAAQGHSGDEHRRDVADGRRRHRRHRLRLAQGAALRSGDGGRSSRRSSGSPPIPRISAPAARDERGPAARIRLWDARDILRPHREPEVRRVDLAPPLLDIIAWGGDPRTFAWFERPPEERIEAGLALLERSARPTITSSLRALPAASAAGARS